MILGLAPMDGFTDCAFRQITKEIFDKYGEKEKYEFVLWTEFMNADGYMINPLGVIKHLLTSTEQAPVVAQIFSGNQEMLLKCFADIQNKYGKNFLGLELNMGCPARNVMNTGGGSALLRDRERSLSIITQLAGIMNMPFSVKTRTGLDEQDLPEQIKFLVEVSTYVSMITIHGRTVKQGYADNGNWEFIYELKQKADKKCKIIGNGGIKSYQDIEIFKGNLDGVGIGQAAIGNPRIFTPHTPSREEIKETVLKHLDYMITYENYFQKQKATYQDILVMPEKLQINVNNPQAITLAEFRKHLFQYVKGIPGSKEFKMKISTIIDYDTLVDEIQNFFSL